MSISEKNHQYYTIYYFPTFGPPCLSLRNAVHLAAHSVRAMQSKCMGNLKVYNFRFMKEISNNLAWGLYWLHFQQVRLQSALIVIKIKQIICS
jgi:hypothetical protein